MKTGDVISIANIEYTVRRFTAEDLQQLDFISEKHNLKEAEAKLAVISAGKERHSRRSAMLKTQLATLDAIIDRLIEKHKTDGLNKTESEELARKSAEADEIDEQIALLELQTEQTRLIEQGECLEARHNALTEMLEYLSGKENLSLSGSDDLDKVEELLRVGKYSLPLSAFRLEQDRFLTRNTALLERAMSQVLKSSGLSPESKPQPQELQN